MKTSLLKLAVILLMLGIPGAMLHAAPEPADPILGRWAWHNDRIATFKPDGTCDTDKGDHGTWQYLNNPEAQRHYRLTWGHGLVVTKFILSEDTKTGQVVNDKNEHFNCRRATD